MDQAGTKKTDLGTTAKKRWAIWLLGLVLFAQGFGKLLNVEAYVSDLSAFRFFPSEVLFLAGLTWMVVELSAGVGLMVTGLVPRPRGEVAVGAAALGVAIAVGYAVLTVQAYARGLPIENCTCFGVYLQQPLSGWVLLQDAYVLFWSSWVFKKSLSIFFSWKDSSLPGMQN